MEAKKRAEGEEHMRLASKALKTSLTKWTPDYDTAAYEYAQAGTCFKVAKAHDEALSALAEACVCHNHCRQLYQGAKALETSILICKDAGQLERVTALAERGGLLYRQHGSPESAAQLLEKAAKILENGRPRESLALYQKAADTILTEDRPKQAAELLGKVSQLQAREKLWSATAKTLEQALGLMQESGHVGVAGRYTSALVLVHLVADDVVAAGQAMAHWGGYCDPDQASALNTIIEGMSTADGESVRLALARPAIKNLDVAFTIMVREIKIPEETDLEAAAAAFGAQRAAAIEASQPPDADETPTAETNFGVEAVPAPTLGHTPAQKAEAIRQNVVDEEEEDELC
eukprot:snap_masked-scaffold438_size171652-processed-gene-0.28 protein:Tk03139 transcript:snap_masked-scaffold438_size171652-processed-gene-0.28-mRNA-1 annotation:"gamma-soluble nsf attachment protein"